MTHFLDKKSSFYRLLNTRSCCCRFDHDGSSSFAFVPSSSVDGIKNPITDEHDETEPSSTQEALVICALGHPINAHDGSPVSRSFFLSGLHYFDCFSSRAVIDWPGSDNSDADVRGKPQFGSSRMRTT
jgi:hypothetical protein